MNFDEHVCEKLRQLSVYCLKDVFIWIMNKIVSLTRKDAQQNFDDEEAHGVFFLPQLCFF